MLTQEDDVDAHALRKRGWSISAIARHLGHDRKTIRAYLIGERTAGVRVRAGVSPFDAYASYCRERLVEDPHLWAMTLFDEIVALGFAQSYPTFTRQLRDRELRPACERCHAAKGRPVAIIDHRAGDETQWDWVDVADPPAAWGWGLNASLFVGALAHCGRWRGRLAESKDQPHTIDALDQITRALGGLTRVWRFDRMATVCHPGSGRVTASFAGVAKHYGVSVAICPPRRGNRKGVVEKANDTAAQRWWRTLPDDITIEDAQASLDRFCLRVGDARRRVVDGHRDTVAVHGAAERLTPSAGRVPGHVDRRAQRHCPSACCVPPEPLLDPSRARPHDRQRDLAARVATRRYRHCIGDCGRPSRPRTARRRRDSARSRTRRRPRPRRHGGVDECAAAPAQTTHPARARRTRSRRGDHRDSNQELR